MALDKYKVKAFQFRDQQMDVSRYKVKMHRGNCQVLVKIIVGCIQYKELCYPM